MRDLTIVGASARAAAYSAARAGFFVHAADLFADLDLCRLCPAARVDDYPAGLAEVLAASHPGGWLYTGGLENHPAVIDAWTDIRPLLGNHGDVLRRVRNPHIVADALQRAGLPCPAVASDATSLSSDLDWLCKPLTSAGGLHISRWNERDSTRHASRAPGPCYFQQFIEGAPCSAVYVAARRKAVLLGITRQLVGTAWTGSPGFQYAGSIGPLTPSTDVARQFAEIGSELAHECELIGLFGVDAIVNSSGVWPVEVNPRYTASIEILEWAHGLRAIEVHVQACTTGQLPAIASPANRGQFGKAIVFATNRLMIGTQLAALAKETAKGWPLVADIPAPDTTIEAGWPILTVFAAGDDERSVSEKLQADSARIRRLLNQQA